MWKDSEDYEKKVARHYRWRGYKILYRNFSCRFGEIDIVALKGNVVAIVEVRVRNSERFGGAWSSVIPAKQMRIIRTTELFQSLHPQYLNCYYRFDVATVRNRKVHKVVGAFTSDEQHEHW